MEIKLDNNQIDFEIIKKLDQFNYSLDFVNDVEKIREWYEINNQSLYAIIETDSNLQIGYISCPPIKYKKLEQLFNTNNLNDIKIEAMDIIPDCIKMPFDLYINSIVIDKNYRTIMTIKKVSTLYKEIVKHKFMISNNLNNIYCITVTKHGEKFACLLQFRKMRVEEKFTIWLIKDASRKRNEYEGSSLYLY